MASENRKSYIMLIISMCIFGTIGLLRRYIPLSSALLAFFRGLLGTVFLVLFMKVTGKSLKLSGNKKQFRLLLLSGAFTGINWILLFEAYNYTSIARATLSYYMEPTLVMLLSAPLLKEKLNGRKWAAILLSLLGMALVSGVFEDSAAGTSDGKGIAFGLGAAALYAAVVLLNKKVTEENAFGKTALQLGAASVVLLPYLLLTEDFSGLSLEPVALMMLLILGIVHTGVAYVFYYGSLQGVKAQSAAVLSYIDPVLALVLSALVLGEKMSLFGILGAVLILGSVLLCEAGGKKKV